MTHFYTLFSAGAKSLLIKIKTPDNPSSKSSKNFFFKVVPETCILLCLLLASLSIHAQIINTASTPYDYGTGLISANTAPFSTAGGTNITISGNDVTVTGNVTILTGATTTSGIYNFHNLTINAGATVTVSGTSSLVIKCTGTVYISGTINATGTAGQDVGANVGGTGGVTSDGGGVNGGNGIASGQNGNLGFSGTSYLGNTTGKGIGGTSSTAGGNGGGGGGYATAGGAGGGSPGTGGTTYGDAGLVTLNTAGTTNLLGGSGGAGGGARTAATLRAGAGGGGGGGALSITANSIIIASTGIITVKGGKGGQMTDSNSSAGGAGGGGSGGTILLQYLTQLTGVTSTPGGPGTANTNVNAAAGSYSVDISGGAKGIFFIGGDGGSGRYLAQQDVQCVPPTTQANSFSNTASTATTADISWARGNGDNVLVIGRYSSAVSIDPNLGTSYTDNAAFGSGQEVGYAGSGEFVVYNGPSTGITVTGLQPGGTYFFSVYEYFSSGNCYTRPALTGTASATTACFRTVSSGNWNNPSIWQMQTSCTGAWSTAPVAPDFGASSILLQTGFDITVTANVTIDETTVQTGASLTVASAATLTINDGTGTDIDVTGTMNMSGNLVQNAGATVNFNGGSIYNHTRDGGSLPIATWATNTNCNVTGVVGTAPANMAQNFYNFLWDNASQAGVIGFGNNFPTGMAGTCEFRRCGSSQLNWDAPTFTWAGDLIVSSNKQLFVTSATTTAKIYTVRDVYINTSFGAASKILMSNMSNVATVFTFQFRNLTINGAILDYNAIQPNNTVVNCSGNVTVTNGTIFMSNDLTAGTSTFNFTGTTQQDVNITGTSLISGKRSSGNPTRVLAFNVISGAIVNFAAPFVCGAAATDVTFTAAAGSTLIIPDANGIVATAGATTGSVRVPTTGGVATFNTTASYTYSGTAIQVTGAGLPATVNNLTFTNPVGVTCPAETVTGNLTITNSIVTTSGAITASGTSGIFNITGSTLTLGGALSVSGVTGSMSMTTSLITLGNNNLSLTGTFTATGSNSNKIITNGTGSFIKGFAAAGSITFPVTDNSSVYTPCTVTYTGGTFSGSTTLSCRVTNAIEPNVTGPDKLNRYWSLSDNIVGGVGNATFNYLVSDVIGTETNIYGVRYNGLFPAGFGLVDNINHRIVATGFGDFTAANFTGGQNPPEVDCYRTHQSGNWNDVNTWEIQLNCSGSWIYPATSTPTAINSNSILIQNGNHVAVTADVNADQLTFDNDPGSSTITVNSPFNLTILDEPGNDIDFSTNVYPRLIINGTLTNQGQINGSTAITTIVNGTYIHSQDGGTLPIASWNTNSNCNVTGVVGTAPTNMAQNFYNFLWDNVSQAGVIGFGNNFPTGMAGTCEFRRCGATQLNWDAPTFTWAGDLIVSSNKQLFVTSATTTAKIYTVRDVYINTSFGAASKILMSNMSNVATVFTFQFRNLTINGAILDYNAIQPNNTVVNCSGNVTLTNGTIFLSNDLTAGTSTFNFNGTTEQDVNITGTSLISGKRSSGNPTRVLAFNVLSGAIVNLATPFIGGTGSTDVTFTVANGGTLMIPSATGIVATAGTTLGSVQVPATGGVATFNTGANYTYNGTAAQVTGTGLPATVNNFTLSNSSGSASGVTLTSALTVNGVLTLNNTISSANNSRLTIGTLNLTLGAAATVTTANSFSATNMIVADGTGSVVLTVPVGGTNGNVTLPLGDVTGTAEYSPVTFNFLASAVQGTVASRVVNATHPNMNTGSTPSDFLGRYFVFAATTLTNYSYTLSLGYTNADVTGSAGTLLLSRWNATTWTAYNSTSSGNTMATSATLNNITAPLAATCNFTGRDGTPVATLYYRSHQSGDWGTTSTWETDVTPAFSSPTTPAAAIPTNANSISIQIQAAHTVTFAATTYTASYLSVDGTLQANAGATSTITGAIRFNSGAIYNHNLGGATAALAGAIPIATWATGSNCNIIGATGNIPTNLAQNFYNFLWNCPGQTFSSSTSFLTADFPTGITGTFEVRNTGALLLDFDFGTTARVFTGDMLISMTNGGSVILLGANATGATTLTVRDLTITGNATFKPNIRTSSALVATINVTRDLTINSTTAAGAKIDLDGGGTEPIVINIARHFTMNGTSATATITRGPIAGMIPQFNLNGTAQQNINITGTCNITSGIASTPVAFTANAGSIVNFNTPLTCGTGVNVTFTSAAGSTLMIPDANGITTVGNATGSVQVPTTRTFNTAGNYTYTGSLAQSTGNALPSTVNNLSISNTSGSSTGVSLSGPVTVNGTFALNNGLLTLVSNNLTISTSGIFSVISPSVTKMIVADGSGQLIRSIPFIAASTSLLFPVGDGAPNYTPVNLTFGFNTTAGTVGIKVSNSIEVNMNTPSTPGAYLSRYWTFSNATLTTYSYTGTFDYPSGNIVGTETLLKASRWTGSAWFEHSGSSAAANELTINSVLDQGTAPLSGDFTGRLGCAFPVISSQPSSAAVCTGNAINLSVTASGAGITYQWVKGVANISGATDDSYTIPVSTTGDAGLYSVVVTGTCGSTTSTTATITIDNLVATAGNSGNSGLSGQYCSYDNISFSSGPTSATSSYVWSNGVSTQNQTLSASGNGGAYNVIVTDINGCTSLATTSVVVNVPAITNVTPTSNSTCSNDITPLTASGSLTYSWAPSAGLDFTDQVVVNASPSVDVTYTVTGTDANGCTTNNTSSFAVRPSPVITVNPPSTVCTGQVTVVLNATGGLPDGYTWLPNLFLNVNTGSTVTAQISEVTFYTVTGTSANGCTANSDPVPVATVPVGGNSLPAFSVICNSGTKALVTLGAAGNSYQWQISTNNSKWTDITGATKNTYTTKSADAASRKYYRMMAESNACYNVASTTSTVDISTTPIVTITNVTSSSVTVTWSPFGTGQYNISWSGAAGSGSSNAVTTNNFTISSLTANQDLLVVVTPATIPACGGVGPGSASTHTLCSRPVMTNVVATVTGHGFTASWTTVSGATSYRLFYRDLYTQSSWSFTDVTGTSVTIPVLYGGHTFAVYVAAKNCPSSGNIGDGSAPMNYVTTNPGSSCNPAPTVASSSSCPNQIHVDISGTPPPYNLILRRISPGLTSGASYPVNTTSVDITVGTQYAGSTWEIFATKNCGGGSTSILSNVSLVTVKPGCPTITNLVLSHPSCFGFTASWNADDCAGLGISGYQLLIKKNGSANYNGYPVGNSTHATVGWLPSGLTWNVEVMSIACNGATSALSIPDTISSLACGRTGDDEQAATPQNISGNDKEAVTVYPNPSEGQFWVNLGSTTNSEATVKIELVNQLGQVVQTNISQMTNGVMNQLVNTPQGLATGIYFVRTSVGGNVYVNRLMISKE